MSVIKLPWEHQTRQQVDQLTKKVDELRKEIRAVRILVLDHEQKLELIKMLLKGMLEEWPKE